MAKKQITPEEREKIKKRMKIKRRKIKKVALYTFLALFVVSLILFLIIRGFGILPTWALVIVGILFLLILGPAGYFSILPSVKNAGKILQSTLNIFLCIAMLVGCFVIPSVKGKLEKAFVKIPDEGEMNINVYVLADSGYNDLEQLAGMEVGVQKNLDQEYQEFAIKVVNKEIEGSDISTVAYDDIYKAVDALYNQEIDAIMLNESYADIIESNDSYSDFSSKTNVLYQCVQQISLSTGANAVSDLTKQTFIVAVTGVDQWDYSAISATAKPRSDVNMLLVVNPVSHQILMITIPRDSYVTLYDSNFSALGKDKLTHATVLGMDYWIRALDALLDVDVNYYVRVNFSSLRDIVDALDGIDVENPYYFESSAVVTFNSDGSENYVFTQFQKGTIHLDGAQALGYCRERYYVREDTGGVIGDMGRNLHQSLVLKACVKKACSVSVLAHASDLLTAVQGKFTTNLEMNDIYALVNMQLSDMADWTISTYALTGSTGWGSSYVIGEGSEVSIVELNSSIVSKAKEYIQQAMNGEEITIE